MLKANTTRHLHKSKSKKETTMLSINIKFLNPSNEEVSHIFTTDVVTIYERALVNICDHTFPENTLFLAMQDSIVPADERSNDVHAKAIKAAVLELEDRVIVVGDGNIYVMNDKGSTIDRFAVWQYNKPI